MGTKLLISVDYYQYYLYCGEDFDTSSVDYLTDGLIAPRGCGARINTEFQSGELPVEVRVQDGPLRLPENPEVHAAAANLRVTEGVLAVAGWAERHSFEHPFGTEELICSVLVERHTNPEAHTITVSNRPITPSRWRSVALARQYPSVPPGWPETPDLGPEQQDDDDRIAASFAALAAGDVQPSTPLSSAEVDAAFWGGRPPSAALLAVGDIAAGVADVDPDFADALATAPPDVQRRILIDHLRRANWWRTQIDTEPLLDAIETGRPLPTPQLKGGSPWEPSGDVDPDSVAERRQMELLTAAANPDPAYAVFSVLWLSSLSQTQRATAQSFAQIARTYLDVGGSGPPRWNSKDDSS